jgi:hypothetical protein
MKLTTENSTIVTIDKKLVDAEFERYCIELEDDESIQTEEEFEKRLSDHMIEFMLSMGKKETKQ